jgi:hypothetical protein
MHVHIIAAQQRWRQLVDVLLVDGRGLQQNGKGRKRNSAAGNVFKVMRKRVFKRGRRSQAILKDGCQSVCSLRMQTKLQECCREQCQRFKQGCHRATANHSTAVPELLLAVTCMRASLRAVLSCCSCVCRCYCCDAAAVLLVALLTVSTMPPF